MLPTMRFVYCTDTGDWSSNTCDECDGRHIVVDIEDHEIYPKFLAMLRTIRSAYWGLQGGSIDVMDRLERCFVEVTGVDLEGGTAFEPEDES